MSLNERIFVAGHRGMVGSAILRALQASGYSNLVTRTHAELDLTNQSAVHAFFQNEGIDHVYLAAAKVGGIYANNNYPAEFIHQNLMIQTNVIHEAWQAGVKKLLFLGSSCIYPRDCPQPIKEEYLLTGPLEPTNEPYAIAKIAGIKMCESYNRQYGTDYRCVMPCNLYGPGDNYHPENSHVVPALIRRIVSAKLSGSDSITVWGTGTPLREFLYVDDLADCCIRVTQLDMTTYRSRLPMSCSHINLGSGQEIRIAELAELLCHIIGYPGQLNYETGTHDGVARKVMETCRLADFGIDAETTPLLEGLRETVKDFLNNEAPKLGLQLASLVGGS